MIKIVIFISLFICSAAAQMDSLSNTASEDSARIIVEKYIDAIGGREKLASVENRITTMTGTVQGFDVKMTIYQKAPAFLREEIQASGLDQLILFNGSEGIMKIGDDVQHIIGDELEKMKYEAMLGLILNPDSAGIKMELIEKTNLGDTSVYRIRNTGKSFYWDTYYDAGNFLKILEEKEVKTPSGRFVQKIWFSDYKEVEGLKFPFTIRQQLGAQELNFKVHSIKINQEIEDKLFDLE